jgi:cytochrome c oxidase subunit 2
MRQLLGKPEFNYLLYCNNICGNTHFNMLMTIVVDTEEDYKAWLKEQKTFGQQLTERLSGGSETKEDTVTDTMKTNMDSIVVVSQLTGK